MRISSLMIQRGSLMNLRGRLEALSRAASEATSGRRIQTVSDQPMDAVRIMELDGRLRDVDQFRRNSAAATTRLSAEDAVLTNVRDLLARAKSLSLSGATDSPSDALRTQALDEVRRIHDQLVSLGNTQVGDEFILGGSRSTAPPFLSDGTYVGDRNARQAQVGDQFTMGVNHTGDQVLSSALAALAALTQALQTGTRDSILSTGASLSSADQEVLASQADVGSRLLQIKQAGEELTHRAVDDADRRDALRNADPTESMLNVTAAQTALERAYAVVGKVLSINLLDYLRP